MCVTRGAGKGKGSLRALAWWSIGAAQMGEGGSGVHYLGWNTLQSLMAKPEEMKTKALGKDAKALRTVTRAAGGEGGGSATGAKTRQTVTQSRRSMQEMLNPCMLNRKSTSSPNKTPRYAVMSLGLMRRAFLTPGLAHTITMRMRSMAVLHGRGRGGRSTKQGGYVRTGTRPAGSSTISSSTRRSRAVMGRHSLQEQVEAGQDSDQGEHRSAQKHHELPSQDLRVLVRHIKDGPGEGRRGGEVDHKQE